MILLKQTQQKCFYTCRYKIKDTEKKTIGKIHLQKSENMFVQILILSKHLFLFFLILPCIQDL